MNSELGNKAGIWHFKMWQLVFLVCSSAVLVLLSFDGLELMVKWWERDEYSHGYMLPFVAAYFIWLKVPQLRQIEFKNNWYAVAAVAIGLFAFLMGELSTLYTVIQYAFLLTLFGLILSFMGWKGFKVIFWPLMILFFMVPLPNFLFNNLSAWLQLISSELGVAVIRYCDISVFLEGNVIDLGEYKLQVVEACSGLNYLFPLMSLGFITAYIFKGSWWKRALVFLSTAPITVLMNSFRIGVIGVLVEYWGQSMAEGFLHDFEGWIVFMACAAILLLEVWILSKIGKDKMAFSKAFALDGGEVPLSTEAGGNKPRSIPVTFYVSFAMLAVMAVVSVALPERAELIPERKRFAEFSTQLGDWVGKHEQIDQIYIDALKVDDNIITDFHNTKGDVVNFYVAYYDSQRKGASAHSPRSCLPGGGWRLKELAQVPINGASMSGVPLRVNRVVIQLGDVKQLVYYWFQQRGRVITNEYLVKWYLFWDALTQNRTDGALVRVTAAVAPGQGVAEVDDLLKDFVSKLDGRLDAFVPGGTVANEK